MIRTYLLIILNKLHSASSPTVSSVIHSNSAEVIFAYKKNMTLDILCSRTPLQREAILKETNLLTIFWK